MKFLKHRWKVAAVAGTIVLASVLGRYLIHDRMPVRRDDMAASGAVAQVDDAQQRVAKAMAESKDIVEARIAIFGILKEDLPFETRRQIMDDFARKYKAQALVEIKKEILLVGDSREQIGSVEKKDRRRFEYLKTLAYGLALFGESGFDASVELVKTAGGGRARSLLPSTERYTLLQGVCTLATYMMLENGMIDKNKAGKTLVDLGSDTTLALRERGIFMRWAIRIRPAAACDMKDRTKGDAKATELINLHLSNELRGMVPCAPGKK